MSLRIRRGTEAQRTTHVFDQGEIVYTTDTNKLYVGDGQTSGGVHALKSSVGVGFTFNDLTQRIDFSVPSLNLTTAAVAEDPSRKYFTDARALSAVGTALQTGPNNGITFTFNPSTGVISATVTEGINALLPSQTGNNGKWLTTDGSTVSWATAPLGGLSFPSPSGHQSQFLTTADGATLSWASPTVSSLTNGAYALILNTNGTTTVQGNLLLASTVDIKRDNGSGVYTTVLGGMTHVSQDTSPALGGNLDLSGHNITGTGSINTTGSLQVSGTIVSGGLSASSVASSGAISAGHDLSTYGNFYALGTIGSTGGLGTDLILNGNDVTGTGDINITGQISASRISLEDSSTFGTYTTLANGATFDIFASNGTLQAPTALGNGDVITAYIYNAHNGTDFVRCAGMGIWADGNLSNGVIPGKFIFGTADADGTTQHISTFDSKGVFSVPVMKTGSYATTSYPSSPSAGMIIFDSTTNHFMGYNGTIWKQLDN